MSIADLRFYSPFSHVLMFSQYNSNLLSRTDGTGSVLGDGLSLRRPCTGKHQDNQNGETEGYRSRLASYI